MSCCRRVTVRCPCNRVSCATVRQLKFWEGLRHAKDNPGVCSGSGGFLLIAGLVCAARGRPGVVKKTPLDVNSTTHLSGQAEKLNPATGELEANPVKATSITKSDAKVSDDKIVAFTNSTCLVIDEGDVPDCVPGDDERLITASVEYFATDRVTAEAVNDPKYLLPRPRRSTASRTSGPSTSRRRPTPTGTARPAAPSTRSTCER